MPGFKTLALLALLSLGACVSSVDSKGHEITEAKKIPTAGMSTDDVQAMLGSPSSKTFFGDETWYYISAKRENRAILAPTSVDQHVLAVHFGPEGAVASTEEYGMKDAKRVAIAKDETRTEGHTLGFMEQLLGNIGRFNKQQAQE